MKTLSILVTTALLATTSFGQESDSTGLAGDDLDLSAVLELFKESESPEDFEKKLNSEESEVNNLDLNEDGEVDYIRVVDHGDSISHALQLQVPVNEEESQDVAVIEMEKVDDETVNLQVIGDSELYGEEYMLEPQDESNTNIVVNVNTWRPVRFIYGPRYRPWVSPWRYRHYPRWFRPWRPVRWGIYHNRWHRHHRHYRRVRVRRCVRAHRHYHAHHTHSHWFKTSGKKSATYHKSKAKSVSPHSPKKKSTAPKKNAAPAKKATPAKKSNAAADRKRPGATTPKKNTSNQRKQSGAAKKKNKSKTRRSNNTRRR